MNRELAEIFLTPDGNPVAGSSREDLDLDKISAYFRDVYDLEIKSDDDMGSIIDRFDCYETSPESVDAVIHRDYRYADQLGRGIPLVIRKIQKLTGFKFHLQEYDEAFSASVEFPSKFQAL